MAKQQVSKPADPTVADAEAVLADLEKRKADLLEQRAADDRAMSAISYRAHAHADREAVDKLNEITEDILRHDTALKSIDAAIVEAGERLKAAQAAEQQAQAREVAKELLARADAVAVHAAELDSANMTRIAAARAISEELQKMRALAHGLGVFVPSEQQFLSLGERAERTVLMATPWSRVAERIAPGERRTHSSYAQPWRDQIVKAAGALLGDKQEAA
jgi:flagellar biosynthesis/type III secretory pathway chaperone